jgi:RNA polymerase sigma-70 factor (ECF subfamily)
MNVLHALDLMRDLPVDEPAESARAQQSQAREVGFAELVERQSGFLFRVACAIVRNAHDAEDVVQETFLKLYRTGSWERMRDEKAFLARTAWRIAIAKRPVRPTVELDASMPALNASSPEDTAIAANWNSAVHRLIDALPESLRRPLALSAIEELTSRQIADIMDIQEGTVRTRILRARRILREKMAVLGGSSHATE